MTTQYKQKPVAYLDVDDTLIRWLPAMGSGFMSGFTPIAAPGAREFLRALKEQYEVRWLTYWCPDGEMSAERCHELARLLRMDVREIYDIKGANFSLTMDKQDGIVWHEHVGGRPFIWIEDDQIVGHNLRERLKKMGLFGCYHECNVTNDPDALRRVHEKLFGKEGQGDHVTQREVPDVQEGLSPPLHDPAPGDEGEVRVEASA